MKDEQARSFFFAYPDSFTITLGMFFVDFNSLTILGNAFSPFLLDSFAFLGMALLKKPIRLLLDGLTNQLLLNNDTIALHKRLNGRLTIAEAVVENRSFLCAATL